jgi:hypothetical protein
VTHLIWILAAGLLLIRYVTLTGAWPSGYSWWDSIDSAVHPYVAAAYPLGYPEFRSPRVLLTARVLHAFRAEDGICQVDLPSYEGDAK